MTRPDDARLLDILLSARKASEYIEGVDRGRFLSDSLLQDAVLRRIELIGEAAAKVGTTTRDTLPDMPWHEIAGMRNRLAHEYFRVDLDIVWEVLVRDLPLVIRTLEAVLPEPPEP